MAQQSQAANASSQNEPYNGIERRRHPRVKLDNSASQNERDAAPTTDRRQGDRRQGGKRQGEGPHEDRRTGDRRKSDRRAVDAMRAELQRNTAPQTKHKLFSNLRRATPRRANFKTSRILLLLVAVVAGSLAAFMTTQGESQTLEPVAPAQIQIVQEPRAQILVAKGPIGLGQRLSPTSLVWQEWPQDSVRAEYITHETMPDAISDMSGAVARFEIFPGEPIRAQKLALADQGYLSVILGNGLRGVSVSVSAESASGGFIVPNDHVDVVATRVSDFGQVSQTILSNVRVLAINTRLGEMGKTGEPADPDDPRAQIFSDQAIATLELNPEQAELVINAAAGGKLSLVLLSITDFSDQDDPKLRSINAAIRINSPFWKN